MPASIVSSQPEATRLTVALPDATWSLEIRTPGFTVQNDETAPDGARRYVYAVGQEPESQAIPTYHGVRWDEK